MGDQNRVRLTGPFWRCKCGHENVLGQWRILDAISNMATTGCLKCGCRDIDGEVYFKKEMERNDGGS
jgi:hypothetical protein